MTVFNRDIAPAAPAVVPAKKDNPWQKINPETLPTNLRKLYDTYKAADDDARDLRLAFCKAARSVMKDQPGMTVQFSNRFGLSFAYLPTKAASSSSLADFADLMG